MTMDEAGNVTYGTDPYGIGDFTPGLIDPRQAPLPEGGFDPSNISNPDPLGLGDHPGKAMSKVDPGMLVTNYGLDVTAEGMANMEAMRDAAIADAQTQKDIKESKTFAESIAKSAYKGAKTGDKKNGKKEGPKHNGPARGGPGKGGPVGGPGHAGGHHF